MEDAPSVRKPISIRLADKVSKLEEELALYRVDAKRALTLSGKVAQLQSWREGAEERLTRLERDPRNADVAWNQFLLKTIALILKST